MHNNDHQIQFLDSFMDDQWNTLLDLCPTYVYKASRLSVNMTKETIVYIGNKNPREREGETRTFHSVSKSIFQ